MGAKSRYLQIRVAPEQKEAIRRLAQRAGQGMSAFVLDRVLPAAGRRFDDLLRRLAEHEARGHTLAALNDLLAGLAPGELRAAVATPPPALLSPYLRNYVAAMVEHAAHQKRVAPPEWIADVEPLREPRFATALPGLRLHLLASSPVPFRRRNLFVDSSVGDRV